MELFKTIEDMGRHAWNMMFQGVAKRNDPLREVALATVDANGRPQVRTIILRDVDTRKRQLFFFTDNRTRKLGEVVRNPTVSVLFWHPGKKVQIRCSGDIIIHTEDDICRGYWEKIPKAGRSLYAAVLAPGSPCLPHASHLPFDWEDLSLQEVDQLAFPHFSVLKMRVRALDVLHLSAERHQRGAFEWLGEAWHMQWVIP